MQQLCFQSEFCASMGTTCCTLLWNVSQREDGVQAMLSSQNNIDAYMDLVITTLSSYLTTYAEDSQEGGQPEENEKGFVLALCGTVTNIAAVSSGREYIMQYRDSSNFVETLVSLMSVFKSTVSAQLKSLCLMALYNLTINKKGHKYLSTKTNFIPLIGWMLQREEDAEIQILCLKLTQSLMCEQEEKRLLHELNEAIPISVLQELAKRSRRSEVREAAIELANDLKYWNAEP
ncbi:heat shock factor 2-binding protein-like [Tachypleus tridentatus]|uniref:heat shock factor 2-binding protein-like n=1 Tax=Tachypleus tridentatus TaxID=6853 RepID=UPI003FD63C5B